MIRLELKLNECIGLFSTMDVRLLRSTETDLTLLIRQL
jgi:hypothetical protein